MKIGEVYSRNDLKERFDFKLGSRGTGIYHHKLDDSIWLFVTETKSEDQTKYRDKLEGDRLCWQGQENQDIYNIRVINHKKDGRKIHLLYREYEKEYKNSGFRYEGEFIILDYERNNSENYNLVEVVFVKEKAEQIIPDINELDYSAYEGRRTKSESAHYRYERDPKLRRLKIKEFLTKYGSIHCEICSFNFEVRYGERGREYIECHHTIPVTEMKGKHLTHISELILLCSNCHRMIHRKKPWLSPDELREILEK